MAVACVDVGRPVIEERLLATEGACARRMDFILLVSGVILLFLKPSSAWIVQPAPHSPCRRHDAALRRHGRHDIPVYSLPIYESSTIDQDDDVPPVLTTALLNISYDGAHFTGWSAANQAVNEQHQTQHDEHINEQTEDLSSLPFRPSRRRRRRQPKSQKKGYVRSVEEVFQKPLAKLYGDVDPSRVVVEGCSRTDKGVHATSMIAQIYCLSSTTSNATTCMSESNIPGKKLPHPSSSHDESPCFEPIPMDLPKLMYVLNRMLPRDVKVMGISPVPEISGGVFHPSIHAQTKTYQYTFSVGQLHDPTRRTTWHLEYETDFSIERAKQICQELLLGAHDFAAFRGAPRGSDDKRKQQQESTICKLSQVDIEENIDETSFPGLSLSTYTVTITGDRFLYKMMRFLVGAIVAVGTDKLTFEDIQLALETGSWEGEDGRKQFTCAPPHGLILKDVSYNVPIEWTTCSNRVSSC